MSKLSREELLWRDEQLQNTSLDIDEPQRRSVERSVRVIEANASFLVFRDKNTKRALGRLRELMEFLFCPAPKLTSEELEFRNELMAEYRLPSLLRIYKLGVWYEQFCVYLRDFVVPKWKLFKKSRTQKGKKRRPKKTLKKSLYQA